VARLYANEQFPRQVVVLLREKGHDVLTVQEAGNREAPDDEVLAFATQEQRAVLTLNRRHFIRLHQLQPVHAGIITCSRDDNWARQAERIDAAITLDEALDGQLIRVNRPG
jgi:predicted nuclease of predicted toxin-antitoxin system